MGGAGWFNRPGPTQADGAAGVLYFVSGDKLFLRPAVRRREPRRPSVSLGNGESDRNDLFITGGVVEEAGNPARVFEQTRPQRTRSFLLRVLRVTAGAGPR